MASVEKVMRRHYPEALHALKAALAVTAVGCLNDNTQPTALIFVALSGAGKTLVVMLITPAPTDPVLARVFYRSDKFTAASFVSHKADVDIEKLQEIDLLPRIKNKTMMTKELSPVLNGNTDELRDRYAVLTSVLDGQGFTSDSGAHGRHGYDEPINFQWLGATTPLQPEALEIMSQVGARLVFYDTNRSRKDIDDLTAYAADPARNEHFATCHDAVQQFLRTFYEAVPRGSVHSSEVTFSPRRIRLLALWAQVLAALRAPVTRGRPGTLQAGQIIDVAVEYPERMVGVLKNIAVGSALIHDRTAVDDYDLAQVGHIALSSGVASRAKVLRALLRLDGRATSSEIMDEVGLTRPTVLKAMRELEAVGLARIAKLVNNVLRAVLDQPFNELCKAPLLETVDRKAKRGEGGKGHA